MSLMTGGHFYSKPQSFYTSGIVRRLNGASLHLYDFLWYEAQRRSRREYVCKAQELADGAGLSVRTVSTSSTL